MEVKSPSSVKEIRLVGGLIATVVLMAVSNVLVGGSEEEKREVVLIQVPENLPRSVEEARGRARWMHEILHGALQVMHRDFFDEDAVERSLPSQSLDDVFAEMARTHGVKIRWLGGNATKGKDHFPQDAFEESAVKALIAGKAEFEAVEGGSYRFVGPIRMQNQCLKCHVRDRTNLEDRVAGLAISFPLEHE